MPSTFVSSKSKASILEKFRKLNIHKWRKPLEELAQALNPVIRGVLNYYHAFWDGPMRCVWKQLNHRLLKWAKLEKGLYKMAAVRWLRGQYRQHQNLFVLWKLVHPFVHLTHAIDEQEEPCEGRLSLMVLVHGSVGTSR